eukprot:m.132928 g.132928  ORF g.132928 m.132928 type:complete len:269 (-) comp17514_c0_seq2:442-1248(-)
MCSLLARQLIIMPTVDQVASMKLKELQDELQKLGLKKSGRKAECKERLLGALGSAAHPELDTSKSRNDSSSLRDSNYAVSKTDDVWLHRGGVDCYTNTKRRSLRNPEVDHCWEVQLLDLAWTRGVVQNAVYGPAHNTRHSRRSAMDVVNDVGNLNVTSHLVNQKKKGPFMRFCNSERKIDSGMQCLRHQKIRDCIRLSAAADTSRHSEMQKMIDNGTWDNIEHAVARAYDDMRDQAQQVLGSRAGDRAKAWESFEEELAVLLRRMGIE